MYELIPVSKMMIGDDTELAVSARDLHAFLGVATRFDIWISRRLEEAQLIENQDFAVMLNSVQNPKGGRPSTEYILTIDAAKHLCMMEKTDKGKEARCHFIQVEKEARRMVMASPRPVAMIEEQAAGVMNGWLRAASLLSVPEHIAQQEAVKATRQKTGIDYEPLLLNAPAQDHIDNADRMLEVSDLAVELNVNGATPVQKGATLNKFLAFIGWQARKGGRWIATPKGKEFSAVHAWSNGKKSGYNLKWNVAAVQAEWSSFMAERG